VGKCSPEHINIKPIKVLSVARRYRASNREEKAYAHGDHVGG